MNFPSRLAAILPAVAASLWLAAARPTLAQDVMELDLAFKSGRLPTSEAPAEAAQLRGRHQELRAAQKPISLARRHRRQYRQKNS